MKRLDVMDCASLALSCKHLGRIAMDSQTLELDESGDWANQKRLKSAVFFARLQKSWMPNDLKRCTICGKFQSTDEEYWKGYKMRRSLKSLANTRVERFWADCNDGYVVKWCAKKAPICPVCYAIRHS